ncbi:MAG: hypothetical protein Faunusvirus17_8 [Faunusvirus sp.]|uniref:Uncharacterized protein n=1 Tax=Faunusvirus sp. TaxID=2487766 RepID=A0A3G5A1X2_9VIRU|nr:MAG: hypothetical protein Faunusvirus17_8 [Faunusvirus sp.]
MSNMFKYIFDTQIVKNISANYAKHKVCDGLEGHEKLEEHEKLGEHKKLDESDKHIVQVLSALCYCRAEDDVQSCISDLIKLQYPVFEQHRINELLHKYGMKKTVTQLIAVYTKNILELVEKLTPDVAGVIAGYIV